MKKNVLWIEDGAFNEITILAAPVHLAGKYHLDYAFSATEGMSELARRRFDAVVVDIRIPPGDDPQWREIYYGSGGNDKTARLGLKLLLYVLGEESKWNRDLPGYAKDATRYGVLSMESWKDLRGELVNVGVKRHRDKGSGDDPKVLLHIIDEILN